MNRPQLVAALSSSPLRAQTPTAAVTELDWVDVAPPAVWNLSRDSAGARVRFTAATPEIRAQWTVTNSNLAGANITAIASSGLDFYAKPDGRKWRWLGIGQPKFPENSAVLINGIPATERDFMVYLPLRNGVTSLEFGVPMGAVIKEAPARPTGSKPIVFYGTSITHGIGASRAGMTHVAMLGRTFNREVVNLGFFGTGRMEPEVVKFVASLTRRCSSSIACRI